MSDDKKKEKEKGGNETIIFEINSLIERDISETFNPKNKSNKSSNNISG